MTQGYYRYRIILLTKSLYFIHYVKVKIYVIFRLTWREKEKVGGRVLSIPVTTKSLTVGHYLRVYNFLGTFQGLSSHS